MGIPPAVRYTLPRIVAVVLSLCVGLVSNVLIAWWCAGYSWSGGDVEWELWPWRPPDAAVDTNSWYWRFSPPAWRVEPGPGDRRNIAALRSTGAGVDRWRVVRLRVLPGTGEVDREFPESRFAVFAGLPWRSLRAYTEPVPFPATTEENWVGGFDLPRALGGTGIKGIVTGDSGPLEQPGIPLIPMWWGTLANTALYGFATYMVFWCLRLVRWRRRRARGRCGRCGYPADAATCPECGLTTPKGLG